MKKLCCIILFLSSCAVFAQSEEKVVRIQDFNEDQIADTLQYELFRGYTDYLIFSDGQSQKTYKLYLNAYKSDFLSFVPIPQDLLDGKHQSLLDSARSRLCRGIFVKHFPPPLTWLMAAYSNKKENPANYFFDQTIQVPQRWNSWPPKDPDIIYSYLTIDSSFSPHIYDPQMGNYTSQERAKAGWLIYYGHNQRQPFLNRKTPENYFTKIDSTNSYELYKTSHGLLLRKQENYAWIFHSNGSLTGGPEKLRWPSMDTLFIHQNHVFIHHISPITQQNRIFIINLENGMLGRLKLAEDFSDNNSRCFSMRVENNSLIVDSGKAEDCGRYDDGPEEVKFPLTEVFLELDKLYLKGRQ